jgi:hypothetical protein
VIVRVIVIVGVVVLLVIVRVIVIVGVVVLPMIVRVLVIVIGGCHRKASY